MRASATVVATECKIPKKGIRVHIEFNFDTPVTAIISRSAVTKVSLTRNARFYRTRALVRVLSVSIFTNAVIVCGAVLINK